MRKIKCISIFCVIAAICLTLTSVSAVRKKQDINFSVADFASIDNASCRYTQPEATNKEVPILSGNLDGFDLLLENESLAVYYCNETNGIKVYNKITGYIWGELPDNSADDLNENWYTFAQSLVSIDYLDKSFNSSRVSVGKEDIANIKFEADKKAVFSAKLSIGISFEFTVELLDYSVSLSLDRDTVKESGEAKLLSVWLAPFFGSVKEDSINGYMFIPDGCGALIRYKKSNKYISPYEQSIYGNDMSVDNLSSANDMFSKRSGEYLTDTQQVTAPVFGVVHGAKQNAFLAVVESGAEYADIYASPAGYVLDYNWVTSRFDYRRVYYTPVNNSGGSIADTQAKPEDFDAAVTYYFLDNENADYSGMALKYRSLLSKNGELPTVKSDKSSNIPLNVSIVAADIKKTLIRKKFVGLTTISQAEDIVEALNQNGITRLNLVYSGWQKSGFNGTKYASSGIDRRIGSFSELEALQDKITANGGKMYLGVNVLSANEDQIRPQSSAAMTIYKELTSYTVKDTTLIYTTKYFIKPDLVVKYINNCSLKKWNYSFEDLGTALYSDYTTGKNILRSDVLKLVTGAVSEFDGSVALTNPNGYLWASISDYFQMPVNNSQYLFETDTVPFLPMVLRGSVDYYAPYANQAFYSQRSILKMIEYGTYPSIIVIGESNEKLAQTTKADYFSLSYDEWEQTAAEVYKKVNDALKNVIGEAIIKHTELSVGVAAVTYESGTVIYVNYSDSDYTSPDGTLISSNSYAVRRNKN